MRTFEIKMEPKKGYPNGASVNWTETRVNFFGENELVQHGRWFEHLIAAMAWRDERIAEDSGIDTGIA